MQQTRQCDHLSFRTKGQFIFHFSMWRFWMWTRGCDVDFVIRGWLWMTTDGVHVTQI